jgi:hypothetical protein
MEMGREKSEKDLGFGGVRAIERGGGVGAATGDDPLD